MGYVYILQSLSKSIYYIGSTGDIKKRLSDHNNGYGSTFTSKYRPWRLVCYKVCETLAKARVEEKRIKSYKGGNGFKQIINGTVSEWSNVPLC